MDNLDELRIEISEIDKIMADLFVARMNTVKKIAIYKAENGIDITDQERESVMFAIAKQLVNESELNSLYCEFLSSVIDISKKYQRLIIDKF